MTLIRQAMFSTDSRNTNYLIGLYFSKICGPFLFDQIFPVNCSPSSSKRLGDKQDSVGGGWNQIFHKYMLNLSHHLLSFPQTSQCQDEVVARCSTTYGRPLKHPSVEALSDTFAFTSQVASEPRHVGKVDVFRGRNNTFSRKN